MQVVHVFVSSAVDGAFCGELQWIKEIVALDTEGAAQLKQGLADPAGPVIHQLEKGK